MFSSADLRSIPTVLIGQHYMVIVSRDPDRFNLLDHTTFLRTGIRIVIDQFARPIGDKENLDTGFSGGCYEFDDPGDRNRWMHAVIIVQLTVRERTFKAYLKVDIADDRLINIENNCRPQPFGVLLSR